MQVCDFFAITFVHYCVFVGLGPQTKPWRINFRSRWWGVGQRPRPVYQKTDLEKVSTLSRRLRIMELQTFCWILHRATVHSNSIIFLPWASYSTVHLSALQARALKDHDGQALQACMSKKLFKISWIVWSEHWRINWVTNLLNTSLANLWQWIFVDTIFVLLIC